MDLEEAVAYMSGLMRFGWKLGNERFEALCERLGNPQSQYRIVHVTGTKGKGSTTALSAALLRASGYRVGSYFSPYVFDLRERVQVNGELIPKEDFARIVTQIRPHIEVLAETELGQTTEFELKTAVAFVYFAEQKVDYACIEVGIGGRLDATNVVHPVVTVITNIGLDHTEILGDTHALIAAEKAGILKYGVPCFTATENPEALEVIERTAAERNVPLLRVRQSASLSVSQTSGVWYQCDGHTSPVTIVTSRQTYADCPMRMGGLYQRTNAACAVAAVDEALAAEGKSLSLEAVRDALATATLPGRLSIFPLSQGPLVVLDGAHNAMAAEALSGPIADLRAEYAIRRLCLIIGMVGGHDPNGVLAALAPDAERIIVCQPNWRRAQPAEEIAAVARQYTQDVEIICSVPEATRTALSTAKPGDMILITGSFYTIGEVPLDSLT